MRYDFSGRTALVTGAGHGFGRAIAAAFAGLGADVFACDLHEAELEQTRERAGERRRTRRVDVTDRAAVRALVAEAEAATDGAVDVLVNNAGGVVGQVGRPLEEVGPDDWRAIFDVNLTGAFYCCQAVAPGMKRRRRGRIVNISSGAGLGVSLTGIQAYASAKAGQIGLTRQLAHELGPWGVTVNSVAPGFVRSNPTTERQWEAMGREGQDRLVRSIALRRLGTPEDIVHAVLFFASDFAGWITGQVLSVDGGR
ncbi:MAG TPA: SDR family NAD(P)-dependent oxidoreductase [Geminicoccaceae bacterium]|nr:SDR family NAD(P)-dependent oxidoreductase [Geminicoccaceae bacterium]